jgi:two-component system LytT family response regulator
MLKSEDVVYVSLDYQAVFAHLAQDKWLLNETLNQLQEKLPAKQFYRANRQFIIHRKYIKEIEMYFGGRIKIILAFKHPEILISKDNVKAFKDWLQQ